MESTTDGIISTAFLTCKCGDCTHWEIGQGVSGRFILCKTCDLKLPVYFAVDDHDML